MRCTSVISPIQIQLKQIGANSSLAINQVLLRLQQHRERRQFQNDNNKARQFRHQHQRLSQMKHSLHNLQFVPLRNRLRHLHK